MDNTLTIFNDLLYSYVIKQLLYNKTQTYCFLKQQHGKTKRQIHKKSQRPQ
jgi:hypothetical protein